MDNLLVSAGSDVTITSPTFQNYYEEYDTQIWNLSIAASQVQLSGSQVGLDSRGANYRNESCRPTTTTTTTTTTLPPAPDNTPPSASNLVVSPSSVDVSSGSADVTITADVSDDLNGLENLIFYVWSSTSLVDSCSPGVGGNPQSGTFSCVITVPSTQVTESLRVVVWAKDIAMNQKETNFSNVIAVTNTGGDNTPPSASNLVVSPSSVDVSSGSADVTITADVSDDLNGLENLIFYVWSSTSLVDSCSPGVGGNPQSGTFSCVITVPSTQVTESLRVVVWAKDIAMNQKETNFSNVIAVTNS